ncbi:hypothetical protein PAHAL_2G077000 [Panicum hallii]|uniref:Uncharacterized protein n=1 Tax=Panicum hallii TaxID=206008 RepID=A0A2S3GWZ9_9POAL|nr:uncharacterized protein LOC112883426 [Panicum hallii]PAN10184.1 hypothetical protein PAHAL_2G077000 [Panicum hallii]
MGCWDGWKPCIICLAIAAAVSGGAVALAAYGFITHVRIAVEDASLTRFDLVEASPPAAALAYNLSLTLTVRNRNWAMAITNRKKLEAAYTFDGQPFDRALLADKGEKHGPRKTRVYHLAAVSNGTAVPTLGGAGAGAFRRQNATGFFEVEVKITGRFKYTARHTKCDLEATCPLKLQLAPPGTTATVFQKVKCKLAKPKKYC